jgi:uncharacterized protein (TIGR03437 family)
VGRWWLIVLILAQVPAAAQSSSFTPSFQASALPAPCTTGTAVTVVTGDFNGDHKPDLAIVCGDTSSTPPTAEISVLLGNGDGTFQPPLVTSLETLTFYKPLSSPFYFGAFVAVDVNGDGRTDLVFNGYGPLITVNTPNATDNLPSSDIIVMLSGPDGTLGAPSTISKGTPYFVEAAADINGDGIPDLLLDGGGFNGFPVGFAVMLGQPGGSFSAPSPLPAPAGSVTPVLDLAADFTAAGTPDIALFEDGGMHGGFILLNNGNGSFQAPAPIPGLPVSPVLAGDFTGDGTLDIAAAGNVVLGESGQIVVALYVALGNGDGTFQQALGPISLHGSRLVGLDINGDGKLDLAQQDGDLVTFFLSNGDGTFQVLDLSVGAPFNPTVVADFNGDGKPDMADTAYVALNTTVIATGTPPPPATGPTITSVVSASDYGDFPTVGPGSWVEIYGTNLAPEKLQWAGSDFTGDNAPTSLDGVSVSIGTQSAFVEYISAIQINAQLPSNIATGGPLQLTVTNGNNTSSAFNITVNTTQPGLLAPASFKIGGNQYVVAQHSNGSYVLPTGAISGVNSSPAQPGEEIVIYGVGFGPVTPNIPAGEIVTETNQLSTSFAILFGQTSAQLKYDGLAPNYVGLYQFNVAVPAVANNDLVPLTFNLGGVADSQTLFTAVHQ